MRARAELAQGCVVHRTIVVVDDYLVDRVEWQGDGEHEVALPFHGVFVVEPDGVAIAGAPAAIEGAPEREDGFGFLSDSRRLPGARMARLTSGGADSRGSELHGWLATSGPATWWSAIAPGPPGHAPQSLVLVRVRARSGSITGVWSWRGAVIGVDLERETLTVRRADGSVHIFIVGGTTRG